MKNKTITINHASGYSYNHSLLTLKEAGNLIKDNKGVILEIFDDRKSGSGKKVFLLNDNRIVVTYYNDGELFSSLKGFFLEYQNSQQNEKQIPTGSIIKRILPTSDFSEIAFYEISILEAKNRISKNLNEITILDNSRNPLYHLSSKEVVAPYSDNYYKLFPNIESFQYYNNYFSEKRVRPDLFGLNHLGKDFPSHVDQLINNLCVNLRIEPHEIQYSRQGFKLITTKIYENIIDDEFKMKNYLPLLAYLGSCAVIVCNDEWVMELDSEFKTWTPELKSQANLPYHEKYYYKLSQILDSYNDVYLPLMTAATVGVMKTLK